MYKIEISSPFLGVASYHYPKITCDIYFNGIKECGGGILALDGQTGKEIWRHYTENEIFALNCNVDIDADGVLDCIAGGRVAVSFNQSIYSKSI